MRERKPEPRDYLDNLLITRDKEPKFQETTLDDLLTAEHDKPASDQIDDLDDYLSTRENKHKNKNTRNEPDNFFNDWIQRYI